MAIAVALVAAGEAIKHQQCGDRGLLLSISTPKAIYQTAEAIPLTFVIINTNKAQIYMPVSFGHADTKETPFSICSGMFIICQNRKGEYLKFQGAYFKACGYLTMLKAGEEFKASTIDLAKFFDLAPGTYDIQLLFTKKYSGFIDAASNRITITVKGNSR